MADDNALHIISYLNINLTSMIPGFETLDPEVQEIIPREKKSVGKKNLPFKPLSDDQLKQVRINNYLESVKAMERNMTFLVDTFTPRIERDNAIDASSPVFNTQKGKAEQIVRGLDIFAGYVHRNMGIVSQTGAITDKDKSVFLDTFQKSLFQADKLKQNLQTYAINHDLSTKAAGKKRKFTGTMPPTPILGAQEPTEEEQMVIALLSSLTTPPNQTSMMATEFDSQPPKQARRDETQRVIRPNLRYLLD